MKEIAFVVLSFYRRVWCNYSAYITISISFSSKNFQAKKWNRLIVIIVSTKHILLLRPKLLTDVFIACFASKNHTQFFLPLGFSLPGALGEIKTN